MAPEPAAAEVPRSVAMTPAPPAHEPVDALVEAHPEPELIAVPMGGDLPVHVAVGSTERVIVYLHGWCGDPTRVREWMKAATPHGTLVALHGDQPCREKPGRYRFGADIKYLDYRIKKALRAAAGEVGMDLAAPPIVLVGYSEGAMRAEDLAWIYPQRYRRLVLMSGPNPPDFTKVRRAEALVVTRGGREYQKTFRETVRHIRAAGATANYVELPGARHGDFGDEPEASMRAVLGWVVRPDGA